MAEKGFFSWLFGSREESESELNTRCEETSVNTVPESDNATLQDAIAFIVELQSYYYNDICKMQADLLIQANQSQWEVNFINKKIKQDQVALEQIDKILKLTKQKEREFQAVWRKSIYSFYDEIEKSKLSKTQVKVLEIMSKLFEINTKPELEAVILNRIEGYRRAWNISTELKISQNYNAVLVGGENNIEQYCFGKFSKQVKSCEQERALTPKQLDEIRTLKFEFEKSIETNVVWVYVSSVTRLQLNMMRRTCIVKNDWENIPNSKGKLFFDVVKVEELEQYLKGILQILLIRRNHAVISIFVPTNNMLRIIGPVEEKDQKVQISKNYLFCLRERSGLYQDNLMTARIDRRHIPEKLKFISYLKFRDYNF